MKYLRKTYEWVMKKSEHPRAPFYLYFFSAIEAIFFPIPVDPFIVTIGAARPHKALYYGLMAAIFSVLGGFLGYLIGYWFWDITQEHFFAYFFSKEKFDLVMDQFRQNAFWSMFLAGFTPLPFKLFTVGAGVVNLGLLPFFLGSLFSRGLRFGFIGAMIYKFGPGAREFIEKYFEKITLITGIIIVLAITIYKLWIQ